MTSANWTDALPTFSSALNVVGAAVVSVTAWFLANYWGKPLLRFWELRRDAYEMIYLYANVRVGHPADTARAKEGSSRLREVGAKIDALRVALSSPVLWYLRRSGYDLQLAADGLTGLSNSLGSDEGAVVRFRVKVQKAFRFFTDPEDQERVERAQRLQDRLF